MIGNIVNNISTILNKYFLFFCYGKAEILAVITPVFSVTFFLFIIILKKQNNMIIVWGGGGGGG